jgi:hypothetical protein
MMLRGAESSAALRQYAGARNRKRLGVAAVAGPALQMVFTPLSTCRIICF